MTGYLLTVADTAQCTHAAAASVRTGNTRVRAGQNAVIIADDLHTVAGCPFTLPNGKPQPCASITWAPATRVFVNGRPAVVQQTGSGQGMCRSAEQIPQGPPQVVSVQTRAKGV
ncbi:hypothetical protein [Actinoplanes sp. DH11]|uniref:hypothetical protein n=1 Tax=Actinoplanes sp. DH11 TaxID=2857011 RepID=UPI001E5A1A33|nr:hypothetical protein [Actinoplanes sp. DH11]